MVNEAAAASVGAWLWLALGHGFFWRLRGLLPNAAPATSCRVAAVIPARDEAATIREAVASLVSQGNVRVIVVDDSSSDGTGALAAQAGATVVHAGPLPTGWTGKLWALRHGVAEARMFRPDYLLFTDADIIHSSDSIARLVGIAERESRDLVSVMVRLNCKSAAERFLVPAFVFFFFMLYPPAWIRRADRRTAAAAGGCVLLRPSVLDRIGGIEAIRAELIDDCALAREVKRGGGSVWLGISDTVRSIREYPEFSDIRRMVVRTAFTQLKYSPVLLIGTLAGMGFLYVLPVAAAFAGSAFGLLAWMLMTALYLPMVRFYRQPAAMAMLLPAAGLFYTAATLESAIRFWRGQGGTWKGRHQAAGQN
jgi:hopene-associated glycosyltransferase HpnB